MAEEEFPTYEAARSNPAVGRSLPKADDVLRGGSLVDDEYWRDGNGPGQAGVAGVYSLSGRFFRVCFSTLDWGERDAAHAISPVDEAVRTKDGWAYFNREEDSPALPSR